MKNKLILSLAFLGLGTAALAQTSDSTATKNHLGIIAKPRLEKIFSANQSLPVGLIYKRQINSDQAVRFSVIGSYSKFMTDVDNNNPVIHNTEHTKMSYQAMAGYEWQKELSKRWGFYYGADFGFAQLKDEENPTVKIKSQNYAYPIEIPYWHSKANSLLLQPFAGFKLQASPRIYFALETAITVSKSETEHILYKHYSATETTKGKSEKIHTDTVENFNIWYRPISNIQLVYKF